MIEVWGVGNKFRSDDSVALQVCDELHESISKNVKVIKYHGDLLNILNMWNKDATVFLIDAIRTGEASGTVHFYSQDEIQPICETSTSTHGLGAATLIEMAKNLDLLPKKLFICGVETQNFELGFELGEQVKEGMKKLTNILISKIKEEESYA